MRHVVLSLPVMLLVAACTGSGQLPNVLSPSVSKIAAPSAFAHRRGQIYVAGGTNQPGYVTVFSQNGGDQRFVRQITSGVDSPICVFVDAHGTAYIGNYLGGNVTVYPAGSGQPSTTLTGAGTPIGVVSARDGTVFVANIGNGDLPPSGASVLVYEKGDTTPSRALPFAPHTFPVGLTLDSRGNLYAAFNRDYVDAKGITKYHGDVYKYAAGTLTRSNLGIHTGHVGQLTADKNDDLLLVDNKCNCIDVIAPGSHEIITQVDGPFSNAIWGLAIDRSSDEIWVTDAFGGQIYGLSYPDGALEDDIAPQLGWTLGVATSPDPLR